MSGISKQERLRRIAYHEAGHAIAALGVRRAFKDVSIVPTEEYSGALRHRLWVNFDPSLTSYDWDPKEIIQIKKMIVITLGGPCAVSILLGRPVRAVWFIGDDHYSIYEIFLELNTGIGADEEEVKEVFKYIEYMELVVKNYLKANWKFVEWVAQALLSEKTLPYKKVKDLVFRDSDLPLEELKKIELPIAPRRVKFL